jgi:hypothetical protein
MRWLDIGQEICRSLMEASRGQRYQLMEAAAARHGLSARRMRDIVACAEFIAEVANHSPGLAAVLAKRSITDTARIMTAWRAHAALRPQPDASSDALEQYIASALDEARKARNTDLKRRRRPVPEPDFLEYLCSRALTWMPADPDERWRTPSTAALCSRIPWQAYDYEPLRHFKYVEWMKAEGAWSYRKLHMVGTQKRANGTRPDAQPIIGIRFISAPSITQMKERAVGIFLEAMGLRTFLTQTVLVTKDESAFNTAIEMCAKADLKNGFHGAWWMYPLVDEAQIALHI